MKDFLKFTLATITGIAFMTAAMTLIGVIAIVSMVASEQAKPSVKSNSVFVLPLSGVLDERADDNMFGRITGQTTPYIGLDDILNAISKAKHHDDIKGIYIEAGLMSVSSPASAQAIRKQLQDFKESGKWIVAYADTYTQYTYYICSVADKVCLNPQGRLDWHGISAQPIFLKDMLEKFGVKMQLSKVGKYKSAPEMFTADKMSAPNRQQMEAYVNGIWNTILTDVSNSRDISKQALNQYADSCATLAPTEDYVKMRLVDGLMYTDEVKGEIKRMLGIDSTEAISQLTLADMKALPTKDNGKGGKIAVYYAYGDVVDSNGGSFSPACIAADKVCKDLERLANDNHVKAVVLRVNSGGGSAYAAEQIWNAVAKLKAQKPVVVSMGGMAASGAYYLSCAADYIYAEPTTLTGSIGIFGMFPDFSGLLTDKLGVKFDEVSTNKFSSFGTIARPFNKEEMAYLDAYIDRGYKLFVKRVADGRKMTVADVDSIAQGRIWTGHDALAVKLVDSLGGMDDALKKAAELADLDEYHTAAYPSAASWIEQLMAVSSQKGNYLDEQMRAALGDCYAPFMYIKNINRHNAIQARMPYFITVR